MDHVRKQPDWVSAVLWKMTQLDLWFISGGLLFFLPFILSLTSLAHGAIRNFLFVRDITLVWVAVCAKVYMLVKCFNSFSRRLLQLWAQLYFQDRNSSFSAGKLVFSFLFQFLVRYFGWFWYLAKRKFLHFFEFYILILLWKSSTLAHNFACHLGDLWIAHAHELKKKTVQKNWP